MTATPAARKRFVDGIRLGATVELAAAYAGVHKATVYRWLDRAGLDDATDDERAWLAEYHEALGAFAVSNLAVIEKAAKAGNWQAAAWKLERRFPGSYSLHQRHTVEGGEKPVTVEHDTTDRAVAAFRAALSLSADERAKARGSSS